MNNNLRKTRMCTRATLINGIEKIAPLLFIEQVKVKPKNYELISAIERKLPGNKKLSVRFARYRFIPHLSTNFRHRMHAVGL